MTVNMMMQMKSSQINEWSKAHVNTYRVIQLLEHQIISQWIYTPTKNKYVIEITDSDQREMHVCNKPEIPETDSNAKPSLAFIQFRLSQTPITSKSHSNQETSSR